MVNINMELFIGLPETLLRNSSSWGAELHWSLQFWLLSTGPPFLSQPLTLGFSSTIFGLTCYINHLQQNKEHPEE